MSETKNDKSQFWSHYHALERRKKFQDGKLNKDNESLPIVNFGRQRFICESRIPEGTRLTLSSQSEKDVEELLTRYPVNIVCAVQQAPSFIVQTDKSLNNLRIKLGFGFNEKGEEHIKMFNLIKEMTNSNIPDVCRKLFKSGVIGLPSKSLFYGVVHSYMEKGANTDVLHNQYHSIVNFIKDYKNNKVYTIFFSDQFLEKGQDLRENAGFFILEAPLEAYGSITKMEDDPFSFSHFLFSKTIGTYLSENEEKFYRDVSEHAKDYFKNPEQMWGLRYKLKIDDKFAKVKSLIIHSTVEFDGDNNVSLNNKDNSIVREIDYGPLIILK